jgi:hypothetical protein
MTTPYTTLDQSGLATSESLLEIPGSTLHPVLIARHMLLLATFLQHLHPSLHKEIRGMSESPRVIMERLAELATKLVTTNDELLGSIEGLACVMLESIYQANIGNLRRSWVVTRRALSIAQLMGLNKPNFQVQYKVLDPKTKHDPQLMWFRIVFMDRYLCLLLGLSEGCHDRSMASGSMLANDTPLGRLERVHCVIASRILERNESDPSSEDPILVRALDTDLQRAARTLPSKWWLAPNLDASTADSQGLFWNTRRLFAQIVHYNLINQLHLPYMLRSSSSERKYEYSRVTCVNASREVLTRFITLRSFNGCAHSCRTVDFLALMAAMTLLLAHLDSYHSESGNLLGHQYHNDRAMVEKVQENMQELNRVNLDPLSAKSADLLRRLLAIDIDTLESDPGCAKRVSVQEARGETALPNEDGDAAVSVHIPYFGIIKIARQGLRKEVPILEVPNRLSQSSVVYGSDSASTGTPPDVYTELPNCSSRTVRPGDYESVQVTAPVETSYNQFESSDLYARSQAQLNTSSMLGHGANDLSAQFDPQLQNAYPDSLLQQEDLPEIVAGADDWAFQGVDWTFFETLMRGSGSQ